MAELSPVRPVPVDAGRLRIRPPSRRLSRRFILWRTLHTLCWAVGVLGTLGAVYGFVAVTRPWLGPVLLVAAPIYAVHLAIMPTLRYRVHRWETTDDAVYALSGWLDQKWQIVPISRIQSIDTRIGPIQRRLRLATVTVTTASAEGAITIEGLDRQEAEEATDRLRELAAAAEGDAT